LNLGKYTHVVCSSKTKDERRRHNIKKNHHNMQVTSIGGEWNEYIGTRDYYHGDIRAQKSHSVLDCHHLPYHTHPYNHSDSSVLSHRQTNRRWYIGKAKLPTPYPLSACQNKDFNHTSNRDAKYGKEPFNTRNPERMCASI